MAGEDQREAELTPALARMARDLLAQESLQHRSDRILVHAVELIDGCESASIMVHMGSVHTLAVSDDRARTWERAVGELGKGPCFDAAATGAESFQLADALSALARWPPLAAVARELGIGSMLGFVLFAKDRDLGVLNLYSSRRDAFSNRAEDLGWLLASRAAVAYSHARTDAHLHAAISSHQNVGMAIGILMERHRLTADDAFSALVAESQRHNVKLRDVARHLVETGAFPDVT